MADQTAIGWCDKTFNYAEGCSKVDEGCTHCYAETRHNFLLSGLGDMTCWGPRAPRLQRVPSYWKLPAKWQREALRDGTQPRVFCSSLADVFELQTPESKAYAGQTATIPTNREKGTTRTVTFCDLDAERLRLLRAIHASPNLTWMLLTKRPEHIRRSLDVAKALAIDELLRQPEMKPAAHDFVAWLTGWIWGTSLPHNVEIGVSCSNQKAANERIPLLLDAPTRRRFVSLEPLLGPVDLTAIPRLYDGQPALFDALDGRWHPIGEFEPGYVTPRLNLVIGGGESGHKARPCHPAWVEQLRQQCACAKVPFFWKQWGEWLPLSEMTSEESEALYRLNRPDLVGEEMNAVLCAELYGRNCTVPVGYLGISGKLYQKGQKLKEWTYYDDPLLEAYAYPGTMMTFRVGVARAGNRLGGKFYEQLPPGIRPQGKEAANA